MDCDHIREALSARLDGEDPGADPEVLDRHLGGCAACTDWSQDLQVLHRLVRVRPAEAVPDLTAAIVAAAPAALRTTAGVLTLPDLADDPDDATS